MNRTTPIIDESSTTLEVAKDMYSYMQYELSEVFSINGYQHVWDYSGVRRRFDGWKAQNLIHVVDKEFDEKCDRMKYTFILTELGKMHMRLLLL